MSLSLRLLERHIQHGRLTLRIAGGGTHYFGAGEPEVEWFVHSPETLSRIFRDPELALGETYMNGEWSVGEGGLLRLFEVLIRNVPERCVIGHGSIANYAGKLFQQLNRVRRSYRNVAHHYDLDEWLFRLFLDEDMHYSCAYFTEPDVSLEEAQRAKCRHVMNKLVVEPGQSVLDIGCGWGSLALYIAEHSRAKVTGITLSREQLRVARQRTRERGLDGQVEFRLADYREHVGRYDRIVSVGMFEHVGRPYYRPFFHCVRELLADDGLALLHNIGRTSSPGTTNAWTRKYIFPGGYIPALSELSAGIEHGGLVSTDIEVLRLHYAQTLAAWTERFTRHRQAVAARLGERFCRMWEFYLAASEASFRWWDLVVFQAQIAQRIECDVPTTRDYLYTREPELDPVRAHVTRSKA